MKKTYIKPEAVTVVLGAMQMMAESLPVGGGDDEIDNPGQILTKENKSVNVWDEEW
ncbi:MAG: hypothetical protein J6W03_08180 [Bacteroidaceae bacterium]|nr:hypothetical protein [Bacteroidaceae bacterium]